MTEFQIGAGLQETNNKGKKQQATKTNSASVKDIALFVFGLLNELFIQPSSIKLVTFIQAVPPSIFSVV